MAFQAGTSVAGLLFCPVKSSVIIGRLMATIQHKAGQLEAAAATAIRYIAGRIWQGLYARYCFSSAGARADSFRVATRAASAFKSCFLSTPSINSGNLF